TCSWRTTRSRGPAWALKAAVEEVQAAARATGGTRASGNGVVVGNNVEIHAEGGSAAAWEMKGPVTIGGANPQQPGATKG
ncbi:hypothetical protein ACFW9W_44265, partial [Streptomyces sp. NPDC059468]